MDAKYSARICKAQSCSGGENVAKKAEQPNLLQQLKQEIRDKRPGRLYIFHGEETFLLHHYLEQLRKLLVDPLTESFNFHKLTSENFNIRDFADAVENLPMMAESTMVWVDEIDLFKMADADRDKMAEILSDIPDYCTVVFTYETVAWKPDKRFKKLFDAIDQSATVVEFAKQEQRELIAWVTRHFAANHKRIAPGLCAYLIDITGGTMTALSGEIAKICAFSGADEICRADIDAVVEPVLDALVFDMTDMLGEREYGKALIKLRQLLKMQEEPLRILGAIGMHFRRLATARTLLDHGKQPSELISVYRMSDYAARKTMSAASKFSGQFYAAAAERILETDRMIKTSQDEPERLLEILVIRLAQEAQHV